jgi:hypothetical protein
MRPCRLEDLRKRVVPLWLGSLAAACALAAPTMAYDISAKVTNTTGATRQGQKLTLYGGQPVLTQISTNAAYNTFTPRAPIVSTTQTTLNYGTKDILVNGSGGIFVRTGTSSALVKSWTWTDGALNSVASIPAVSGSVSTAASPSSEPILTAVPRPGVTTALGIDAGSGDAACLAAAAAPAVGPALPTDGIALDWTLFNETTEKIVIDSVNFSFEDRVGDVPVAGTRQPFVGLRFLSPFELFGGASDNDGIITIPPSGGVVYHLRRVPLPTDPGVQRWVLAEGRTTGVDGMGEPVFPAVVEFEHAEPLVGWLARATYHPKPLGSWHSVMVAYDLARRLPPSDRRILTVVEGDRLLAYANASLAELPKNVSTFTSPDARTLVLAALGPEDQARKQLVAVLFNIADNAFGALDGAEVDGTVKTIQKILEEAATVIASPESTVEDLQAAEQRLQGINTGAIKVLPAVQ